MTASSPRCTVANFIAAGAVKSHPNFGYAISCLKSYQVPSARSPGSLVVVVVVVVGLEESHTYPPNCLASWGVQFQSIYI